MGVAASVRADVCTEWIEAFTSMRLANQEIEKLHNVFTHVDFNGSGSIDAAEMLAFLDIDRTSLSKRLFVNCDRDDNGQMNFYEFVLCCWKLLALKQKSLRKCRFDLKPSHQQIPNSHNVLLLQYRHLRVRSVRSGWRW